MRAAQRQAEALAAELRERLAGERRAAAAAGRHPGDLRIAIAELVEREAAVLEVSRRRLVEDLILRETVGLGPLEELLADPAVEEVMVNRHDRVYAERGGRIELTEVAFASDEAFREAIERILAVAGRRVDELSPIADARLADGSRVNVIVPPLAVDGPVLSIRRFGVIRPDMEALAASGSVEPVAFEILRAAVERRLTVIVSGGTGSGKTTLLNALSAWIDPAERIVTIEDAAELRLRQPHVVRLESRPPTIEGSGAVTIRDLLRNALRMRPDRIVIGEVRGAEAIDLISALNTGHEGAMSTVHANSAADALRRIETLALMAGIGLSHDALREQLHAGCDLVVHARRHPDGRRRVEAISEVVGGDGSGGGPAVREAWRGRIDG